jgi:hypothetical protein
MVANLYEAEDLRLGRRVGVKSLLEEHPQNLQQSGRLLIGPCDRPTSLQQTLQELEALYEATTSMTTVFLGGRAG